MKTPRLLVISGPLKRKLILVPSTGEELKVGRAADNDLCIPDPLAGGHHFAVRCEPQGTVLYDRKTRNGTLIDKKFCIRKVLQHGDRILCGTTAIIYLEGEDPLDVVANLDQEIDEEALRQQQVGTLRADYSVRAEAAIYYKDVLNALSEISDSWDTIEDREVLQAHLLDLMFFITPALRGAILLNGSRIGPAEPDFSRSQFYRERDYTGPRRFFWSLLNSSAIESVYKNRVAYLSNSPIPVLCYPLTVKGAICGVLYLDGVEPPSLFEPEHLQIVSLIAKDIVSALGANRRFESVTDERDLLKEHQPAARPIIGNSTAIQEVRRRMQRAAGQDVTVLIFGETGTGKEAVAHGIHAMSRRKDKPYVAINCGGLQDEFLQSELFGHTKGGYTGATTARKGKLKKADEGTVFLDEIGDFGMTMQAAVLRVLQERTFYALGSDDEVEVDVRIIAATNVNLEEAVQSGKFRSDLFFRLNVYPIYVPPLRERREDIPLLAEHFLLKHAIPERPVTAIAADAMEALLAYDWPGNIRELENAIHAAIINGGGETLCLLDLPKRIYEGRTPMATTDLNLKGKGWRAAAEMKVAEVEKALIKNNGNVTQTAKDLDVDRTYIYKLLQTGQIRKLRNSAPPNL